MTLVIRPHEGMGPISFGMTRAEVKAALPVPREFPEQISDRSLWVTVTFDPVTDRCHWVGTLPEGEPAVLGVPLIAPVGELAKWLLAAGYSLLIGTGVIDGWLRCDDIGVCITRNGADDEEIEAVGAYARGCWDADEDWEPYGHPQ